MKEYSNFILDDTWIKFLDDLPIPNENLIGVYYDWNRYGDKYIQDVKIIDLIYMQINNSNKNEFFQIFKSDKTYTEYIKVKPPYAWKYKDRLTSSEMEMILHGN